MPENSYKEIVLKKVPCINYPVLFQRSQEWVEALLNSGSKVNAMSPAYAKKLGLKTQKTDVGARKIDGSALEIFEMMIADFQVKNKGGRPKYFQETFLVTETKFEVVLKRPFLKLNNADVSFGEETFT